MILVLGWLFLPVYQKAGVSTMPEYLERRFKSRKIKLYMSSLSLLIYVFTKTSVALYSGGVVLLPQLFLGILIYVEKKSEDGTCILVLLC